MGSKLTTAIILMFVTGPLLLISGGSEGTELRMRTDLGRSDASFWGEDSSDHSGYSVAGAGDVNGDGYDDILIGAQYDDDGGTDAGQTYLILGKASGWAMDTDLSTASASFWGEDTGDRSGISVAGAGDVNGDGYDDFLIGASFDDDGGTNAGQTYLILGKATGWAMDTDLSTASASFWGEDIADVSGISVAGAGDVNGDGYDDILIGAYGDDDGGTDAGQTYLIRGKASGWAMDTDLSTAFASFWGENSNDNSGTCVAGAGDVNGDGFDDILIGVSGNDDNGPQAGQTYLILGSTIGWAVDTDLSTVSASFWGEDAGGLSGRSAAGAGDVNGDGYDDIVIGACYNHLGGSNAGLTYLVIGKASGWAMDTSLSTASASFTGEDQSDYSGYSVAGVGDVNGDGYDDILIGADGSDDGGTDAGQTYLVLSGVDPPGPRNLRYALSSATTRVTLNWDAPNSWAEPLYAYRIYRSTNGMDYQYLGFTPSSTRTYADNTVSIGVTYHYMVVADYDEGWENSGKAYLSLVCDRDMDSDGIGNLADIDDDGDGYPDHSDAFPLDNTEWMDSDWDGEGNEADKDDDNDGIADDDDTEPLNPMNGISLDMAALSSNLDDALFEIEGFFESMNSELHTINDTVLERIDELDLMVSAQLYQLGQLIYSVNASIQKRLDDLDSEMATFKSEMGSDLDEISTSIDGDRVESLEKIEDLMELISSLSVSFEGMNETILNEIDVGLGELSDGLGTSEGNVTALIGEMRERLVLFSGETSDGIQNVTNLMARMQELQALSDTAERIEDDLDALNDIQTGVGDIKKEQEDTNSGLSMNTVFMIMVMVLLIIAIVMLSLVLVRGGKQRKDSME